MSTDDRVETDSFLSQKAIHLPLFNDEETKILQEVHRQLVQTGGPINRSRFLKVIETLSPMEPVNLEMVEILFKSCDHDKDGILNVAEWLVFLTVLFRIDPDEIVKLYKAFASMTDETDCLPPEPQISKTFASQKVGCRSRKTKSKTHKVPPHPYQIVIQIETELKLIRLKKSAIIRMKRAVFNKASLYNLWGTVCEEPNLLNAWATHAFPTGRLIKASKTIADIKARGYIQPLSHNNSDYVLLDRHYRLLNSYQK